MPIKTLSFLLLTLLAHSIVVLGSVAEMKESKQMVESNQLTTEIKGQVLSAETGEPLPYTNVYLLKSSLGTVTNQQGRFRLLIEKNLSASDSIGFSFIGYETQSLPVSDCLNKELSLLLKPQSEFLKELVVTPYDVRELIKRAIARIPENYGKHMAALVFTAWLPKKKRSTCTYPKS